MTCMQRGMGGENVQGTVVWDPYLHFSLPEELHENSPRPKPEAPNYCWAKQSEHLDQSFLTNSSVGLGIILHFFELGFLKTT